MRPSLVSADAHCIRSIVTSDAFVLDASTWPDSASVPLTTVPVTGMGVPVKLAVPDTLDPVWVKVRFRLLLVPAPSQLSQPVTTHCPIRYVPAQLPSKGGGVLGVAGLPHPDAEMKLTTINRLTVSSLFIDTYAPAMPLSHHHRCGARV